MLQKGYKSVLAKLQGKKPAARKAKRTTARKTTAKKAAAAA